MPNVKDLKRRFEQEVPDWDERPEGREFFAKLNYIGWDRRTQEPEECRDVDASALLSDQEYAALVTEWQPLRPPTARSKKSL